MADDGDDDYLSDKFLTIPEPQKPKTYSEKRKEALRKSLLKDEQNRTKSIRQLELESREEGLSKSLFERAEDDKASGRRTENKALSMMMKMGFKPGQALGVPANVDVDDEGSTPIGTVTPPSRRNPSPSPETLAIQPQIHEGGLVNPLPLNEWSGRKGIGLGKRAPSPTELERLAKVARATEETNKESFRDRSRREYELRRAEARIGPAQRTCATLDERAGKEFNVFWLDPINPDTFPVGLLEAVAASTAAGAVTTATATATTRAPTWSDKEERSIEERLRVQMRTDALQPLDDDHDDVDVVASSPKNADANSELHLPPKWIEDAAQFLRLNPAERLERILQYLRAEYHYCFWCGTQYKSSDEMEEECPGPEEDMHD